MYPSERKAKELGVSRVNVLDETKKFLIKIEPDGEVSIYVGSYFGDRVYPNPTGVYQQQ